MSSAKKAKFDQDDDPPDYMTDHTRFFLLKGIQWPPTLEFAADFFKDFEFEGLIKRRARSSTLALKREVRTVRMTKGTSGLT